MPITSFAIAFALGREPAQSPEPNSDNRPNPATSGPEYPSRARRGFGEAFHLNLSERPDPEESLPVANEIEASADHKDLEWINRLYTIRTPRGAEIVNKDGFPTPHGAIVGPGVGEPPVADQSHEANSDSTSRASSGSTAAQKSTSTAHSVAPDGVAPAPAPHVETVPADVKMASKVAPTSLWTVRTNDGLAYQGSDKTALEVWAAARNAELARAQAQAQSQAQSQARWNYPASYGPLSGYGYGYGFGGGGCAGGSCR